MILLSVLETEGFFTIEPIFVEIGQPVGIVETHFRLAEVQLAIGIVFPPSAFGALFAIVAEGTTRIVMLHNIVHHHSHITIAEAGVFQQLYPKDVRRLQGSHFLLGSFPSIDGKLHAPTVRRTYFITNRVDAEAGQHQVSQQVHPIGRCLDLLRSGKDQFLVHRPHHTIGSNGHFAQLLGSILQGEYSQIGRTGEAFQVDVHGLITEARNHQPIVAFRNLGQAETSLFIGSGTGHESRVGLLQYNVGIGQRFILLVHQLSADSLCLDAHGHNKHP